MINLPPRDYQKAIFETAKNKNTLVVLPTGIGKTLIAIMLAAHRLKEFPSQKILILAPTKPLIEQHLQSFRKNLPKLFADMQLFTGAIPSFKRQKIWQNAEIIFSTPQCISNDLKNNLYSLNQVSLLVIDEAHRCLKNYDYTFIAQQYKQQSENQRILGLTASPGSEKEKVEQICKHLAVEEVEVRTRDSQDVKPYLKAREFKKIEVPFPQEFVEIKVLLKKLYDDKIEKLKSRNLLFGPINKITLLALQKKLGSQLSSRNFTVMHGLSLCAQAIKISHAIELLETQTLSGLNEYLNGLKKQAEEKKTKGVQTIVNSNEFKAAFLSLSQLIEKKIEHPKIEELKVLIESEFQENKNSKIIVFSQFRETALTISRKLNSIPNVKARLFVGQMKKGETGLSQKEQKQVIESFKEGEINVLCATSIHPDEYIILKKNKRIFIEKIGKFVNEFLNDGEFKKEINGYEALTTNGKKLFFGPITHVHKHHSKNNCVKIKTCSGLDCLITNDHSLFSFNKNGEFVPAIPEKNKFISLSLNCPNIKINNKIDVFQEVKGKNLFGSLENVTQSKIRILKTNWQVLNKIKNSELSITEISKRTKRNYSAVMDSLKRLRTEGYLTQRRYNKNWRSLSAITSEGKEYLKFLSWFFKNVRYKKRKYRFNLNNLKKNEENFNNFFSQYLNVNYGKVKLPRFIEINEETAKFFGFYVSEGYVRKTKKTSGIFLAAKNKKMQDAMEKSIKEGLRLKMRRNWRGVAIDSQIGYYLITEIFKAGAGAYDKEVPEIIFTSPNSVKKAFLEAYILGDGHIAKDKIVITTVSRKLIVGLIFLLRGLGITKLSIYKQKHVYRLTIHQSLSFAKIKEKNEKRRRAYFSLLPCALDSKKVYNKYKNFYQPLSNTSIKCRKTGNWKEDICFDYIKEIKKINNPQDFVYDLSIKNTEKFIGGTGLFIFHNSIGEEGLDIPEVNAVYFYEPIPSAIRKIQRAGRTARLMPGKLAILVTKDTRDQAHHYASSAREKKMYRTIEQVKEDIKNNNKNNKPSQSKSKTLDDFK